jgi:DNA-binding response OmpR family regulator
LAAALGGTLRLLDTRAGASFELVWPLGEARSMTLQRAVRPSVLAGMRVLVLEDDAAVVALLELGLEAQGVHLVSVSTAEQLPKKLATASQFDAALVDLSPLGDDPERALQPLRARGVPVILMSGNASAGVLDSVAASWVRKPFELSEVCEALLRVRAAEQE